MYLSTMMSDLYAYMQQSVEEHFDEEQYEEYQELLKQIEEHNSTEDANADK